MPRNRRELYNKEICACSIFGAMNRDGERFNAAGVIDLQYMVDSCNRGFVLKHGSCSQNLEYCAFYPYNYATAELRPTLYVEYT